MLKHFLYLTKKIKKLNKHCFSFFTFAEKIKTGSKNKKTEIHTHIFNKKTITKEQYL